MVGIPSVEMVILGMVYGIGFSTLWSPIPLIAIHKPWFTIRSHSLLSTIIPVTILQPLTTIFTINYSSLITIVINHCFSLTKTQPRHVTTQTKSQRQAPGHKHPVGSVAKRCSPVYLAKKRCHKLRIWKMAHRNRWFPYEKLLFMDDTNWLFYT